MSPRLPMSLPLFVLLALAPAAHADPVVVAPGRVALPMSGLALELPRDKRPGFSWVLSGSWQLDDASSGFDGRDVIDEKLGETLVAGTWVQVGYFTAGDCDAVVRSVELAEAWESAANLWGHAASLRGGIFAFEGALGNKASVMLCMKRGDRKQLIIHRFFLDQPTTMTREAMLAAVEGSKLLERVVGAWAKDRTDTSTPPLRRPEVRRRGDVEATREVKLGKAGFAFRFPDDGQVWIRNRPGADDTTDWLDLVVPAEPEVTIEVGLVTDTSCADFFGGIGLDRRPNSAPRHLPAGWLAGPTLIVDGKPELTTCKAIGDDALVIGAFIAPFAEDFARFGALIEAIAAGAAAR